MNLILLNGSELNGQGEVRIADARAAHLRTVLKVTPGQTLRIGVVDGQLGRGTVTTLDASGVTLRCVFEEAVPPRPRVDLLLALPRPKVMRRLWAQLAALGVGHVILTNAAKVERNYFDTHVLGEAMYRPRLLEGLQQARDTRVPVVSVHRQLKVLVEDHLDSLTGEALRLVADPGAQDSLTAAARNCRDRRVLLAVGPEGGWTEFELNLLQAHGFHRGGFGPRTLRADTACVALLGAVHDAMADG